MTDISLVSVTLISMSLAVVLSVIVWRLLREERRRSAARVLALAAHAGSGLPIARSRGQVSRSPDAGARALAPHAVPTADLPLNRAAATDTRLFAPREHDRSPWGGRMAVMAGLALAAAGIVFVTLASGRHLPAARPSSTSTSTQATPAAAPLELLSLRDSRDAGTLTITGLVQNPASGAVLAHVAVTAFAFDASGTFLASGRALLETATLAPGDQSPFVVSVPVTGAVARYRIGFRTDDGRVIAHVDERGTGTGDRGSIDD